MKFVLVMDPIQLRNSKTKEPMLLRGQNGELSELPPITHHDFNMDYVCSQAGFGKGGVEGVRRVNKINALFIDAKPGEYVAVEDADYAAVLKTVNEIEWTQPLIGAQLVPFMDAWEKALDQVFDATIAVPSNGSKEAHAQV
jgi:hypothetical protein